MKIPAQLPISLIAPAVALGLALSSCTLKATFDTTSDGITNFLSSTTPGAWFTSDGLVRSDLKAEAFTYLNFENLKHDMAQGCGEYLASVSTLLGVPQSRQPEFFSHAQDSYRVLAGVNRLSPNDLLTALRQGRSTRSTAY